MEDFSLPFAIYLTSKLIGYSLFSYAINKIKKVAFNPVKFGLLKTALGLLLGSVSFLLWSTIGKGSNGLAGLILFLAYVPIRSLIWYFLLNYCYGKSLNQRTIKITTVIGVLFSIALDLFICVLFSTVPGINFSMC